MRHVTWHTLEKYYAQEMGQLHGRQKSVGSSQYGVVRKVEIDASHLVQSELTWYRHVNLWERQTHKEY
jgi:hypothetical protein